MRFVYKTCILEDCNTALFNETSLLSSPPLSHPLTLSSLLLSSLLSSFLLSLISFCPSTISFLLSSLVFFSLLFYF
jgi:hypothetical protein